MEAHDSTDCAHDHSHGGMAGLIVNIASIALLHGHGKNISVRSAVAHMMADAL